MFVEERASVCRDYEELYVGGIIMGKLVKKFSVIAACLSLVLGVMGVCGGAVAKASVNSDPVIMQSISQNQDNTVATAVVKVLKDQYEAFGVSLVCTNGDTATAKTYPISELNGTFNFGDGNSATVEYSWDEGYYIITYQIKRSNIAKSARAYFYSGSAKAENGGYGYFLFD